MTDLNIKPRTWTTTGVENLLRHQGGTYYARFRIGGKRKLISLKTRIFPVAKSLIRDEAARIEKARGSVFVKKAVDGTMGDLFEIYRHRYRSLPISEATKEDRERSLLRLANTWPDLDALRPRMIRPEDVWEWANRLKLDGSGFQPPKTLSQPKVGMSSGAVNRAIYTLRTLLDIAVEVGAAHHNVARERPPAGYGRLHRRVESLPVHLPTQDVIRQLFTAIETPDTGLPLQIAAAQRYHRVHIGELCRFLAYSGARISEARAATWGDDRGSYLVIHGSKSYSSKGRSVSMNPSLRSLLDEIRQRRAQEFARCGKTEPGSTAPILAVKEAQKTITRACAAIKIPRLTHHDLRHLFATRCLEVGVEPKIVADWLGHADGGMLVLHTYGHVRQGHAEAAAAKLIF